MTTMHIFSRFIDFRNRDKALFVLIVLAAVIVRVVLFGAHPAGLNQDEASVGYDAWALMNYGVDRNGYTLALFGLNVFSVRAVNLIFSLLTVIAVYSTLKQAVNKKTHLSV